MLKRISAAQLRVGMFVHEIPGSWLDNPFWRSSFRLDDPEQVDRLRRSRARTVVIDEARGAKAPPSARAAATTVPAVPARTVKAAPRRAAIPADPEFGHARNTMRASKRVIRRLFSDARSGRIVRPSQVAPVVNEIMLSVDRGATTLIELTRLRTSDESSYVHSVAVCALMVNFARHLGLAREEVGLLGMGGLLHDIGKIAIPSALLRKRGALDAVETAVMRAHPREGFAILSRHAAMPQPVLDICLHHHERYDGAGYPDGLAGEAIARGVRMASICDVYDAVTAVRPYKEAWAPAQALGRMAGWTGQFDPDLLGAFVASLGLQPVEADEAIGALPVIDDVQATT